MTSEETVLNATLAGIEAIEAQLRASSSALERLDGQEDALRQAAAATAELRTSFQRLLPSFEASADALTGRVADVASVASRVATDCESTARALTDTRSIALEIGEHLGAVPELLAGLRSTTARLSEVPEQVVDQVRNGVKGALDDRALANAVRPVVQRAIGSLAAQTRSEHAATVARLQAIENRLSPQPHAPLTDPSALLLGRVADLPAWVVPALALVQLAALFFVLLVIVAK